MKKQIPNILSALRIVMVGGFVGMFVTGQYYAALFIYLLAFVTDILDGWLARSNGWITNLGKLLDPLADKLMTVSVLCCMAAVSRSRILVAVLLLSLCKEGALILGGALLLHRAHVVYSDWAGKIAVGLYGVGIVLTLLGFSMAELFPAGTALLAAATGAAYGALIHYAVVFLCQNRRKTPV